MTTPAGWYDDGSGRQRWWDGEQWTEHFAPAADASPDDSAALGSSTDDSPADDSSAAAVETHDSIQSVAAVEAGATWQAPGSSEAATMTDPSERTQGPAAGATSEPIGSTVADTEETTDAPATSPSPDSSAPSSSAQDRPADGDAASADPIVAAADDTSAVSAAPEMPPYATPGHPGAGYPGADYPGTGYGASPAYQGSAQGTPYSGSAYPGAEPSAAAPAYGSPAYGSTAYSPPSGYAGAASLGAPPAPSRPSVLGLIGLGLAVLGTIIASIPLGWIALLGWLMLIAGFVTSVISLFRQGRKWPGITGLIVSIVGGIVAAILTVIIGIFSTIAVVSEEIRDLPTAPPSSESDTETSPPPSAESDDDSSAAQVEEGTIGDTVTLRWLGGTGEVTVTGATWSTEDGSGVSSANGGYLTVETTWTGIDGVTPANPFFTTLETSDGTEGQLDFFVTGAPNELLESGQTVSGPITFDIAQSESYVLVITDEATREIARIAIVPTAG